MRGMGPQGVYLEGGAACSWRALEIQQERVSWIQKVEETTEGFTFLETQIMALVKQHKIHYGVVIVCSYGFQPQISFFNGNFSIHAQ